MSKTKFKQTETCGERSPEQGERRSRTIGEIPEHWGVKELGEICKFYQGLQVPIQYQEKLAQEGFKRFIRIVDFTKTDELFRFVREKQGSFNVKRGDLIMIRYGSQTAGKVYKSPEGIIANNMFKIDIVHDQVSKEYLYYFLSRDSVYNQLNASQTSSTMPSITFELISKLEVVLPSLHEQRAIAKILSDLDEKIELNHQMNKTLEAMGQALFKRWFVEFEFPGHEKTKVVDGLPEGWRKGKFGELAKIQPGFAFKSSNFTSSGYKVIKIANIQNEIVDFNKSDHVSNTVFQSIDKKFYLVSGDVVIAMTGAEIGKIGVIPKNDQVMLLNQRVGKLVSNYYQWAYHVLKGAEIQALIGGISSASSAQPNISNSDIEKTEVIIPDEQTLKHFCQITDSFFYHLISNLGENQILSQIRDSLLPKLMSGKIKVGANNYSPL